ncbi:MAG: hypothetical protein U0414_42355 [Polyangiaceae bacterium]
MTEKKPSFLRASVIAVVVVAATGLGVGSCIDATLVSTVNCPPFEDFQKVSPVLEQRCGTLDCHGNTARPLRLYGNVGLRAPDPDHADDPNYYPGGKTPTTENEQMLNYRAVCALEPELMDKVMKKTVLDDTGQPATPDILTFVRKPRLSEKHKGGRIWDQGKPGDRCLTAWLNASDYEPGKFEDSDCKDELNP